MTWGAFLAAMRNGVTQRGTQASRRAPQAVNQSAKSGSRSASSQSKPAADEAATATQKARKTFPMEEWDFMVLDVCFFAKM